MRLEQMAGAALMLLFLADIFLTVLYARAGTGLLAPYWNRAIWACLRGAAWMYRVAPPPGDCIGALLTQINAPWGQHSHH